jgi:hypothetical protein
MIPGFGRQVYKSQDNGEAIIGELVNYGIIVKQKEGSTPDDPAQKLDKILYGEWLIILRLPHYFQQTLLFIF